MARIPQQELEQLKEEVSVQRLVEAAGVALKKSGKDWLGCCPFHDDRQASLVVTPRKNLWHCFGCQIGGGAIDWVMKHRGVSFRQAVEVLKAEMGTAVVTTSPGASSLAAAPAARPIKHGTVRALPAPVTLDADDQALLVQTIDYYHQRLKDTATHEGSALAYLVSRGLTHPGLVDTFRLGVADRTLGLRVPVKRSKDGASLRGQLQRVGLIRESGHEHFNGSLVVPVFDAAGNVVEVYGRKLRDDLRPGTPKHLYLPGPSEPSEFKRSRGVFNLAGVQAAGQQPSGQREVILCEALMDAMTFWCAGFQNVTSSYGVEGFTDDIMQAFKANGIERVFIAYDRDEAGDRAAQKLAPLLMAESLEVLRVVFPQGMDANEYAQKMQPADKALALVLRQAVWLGGVRPVAHVKEEQQPAADKKLSPVDDEVQATATGSAPDGKTQASSLAAAPQTLDGVQAQSQNMQALPAAVSTEQPDELHIDTGGITWRVRGWKKNTSAEAMKVNLQARRKPEPGAPADSTLGAYFVDTLDLYAARSRGSFLRAASVELGLSEEAVKRELGAVLLKLETLQDELLAQGREQRGNNAPRVPILSADDEHAALELLRTPNLMQRVVDDLHALGVVGEDMNLMAAYLAAVSRKLDTPLAVLIQSSSAAGKSSLMDAVLQLIPEEERIRYSAMTGQSLFYLGETNVQHKILAIAEEEGVRQAAYALKLLQSDGELTIASTAKDEATGDLRTRQYTVKGPVMLMLTTTAIDVDEELMNRCLVLAVNESREQTAAIHARQRHKQTLEGLLQSSQRDAIQNLHHNAQRLLASVAVVNPYADQLTFLADKTRTRRDHMKYLTLIRSIALLHQHQREVKQVQHAGQLLRYIEVSRSDIELANQIAHEVLGRTLDELPPQTRRLLQLIRAMVHARAAAGGTAAGGTAAQPMRPRDVRFTRKDIREATQWSDSQLKLHCARLSDMEYLLIHSGHRGHSLRYELLWDGGDEAASHAQRRRLCGLLDTAELGGGSHESAHTGAHASAHTSASQNPPVRPAQVWVQTSQVEAKSGSSRAQVCPKSGAVNQAPSRASVDDAPDELIDSTPTHRYGELSHSPVVIVQAG